MTENINITLLICVHVETKETDLKKTIQSIFNQTKIPKEIIILKNGPLQKGCVDLIQKFLKLKKNILLIDLKKNEGLAKALNLGLAKSSYEFIGRLDPGDMVINERFLKQINFLSSNKKYSICGSFAFEKFKNKKKLLRKPESNFDIYQNIKYRNPIIHSTVVFKRKDILDIGGYPVISRCQDYLLWIKCIENNLFFKNLSTPLIEVQLDLDMMNRRDYNYFLNELFIYNYMLRKKIVSPLEYIIIVISRFTLRVLPKTIKLFLYNLR